MVSWRDELNEAVKSKAEREAEEQARVKKRVEEALATATQAMSLGGEALALSPRAAPKRRDSRPSSSRGGRRATS